MEEKNIRYFKENFKMENEEKIKINCILIRLKGLKKNSSKIE
jgi:hypothetical protein